MKRHMIWVLFIPFVVLLMLSACGSANPSIEAQPHPTDASFSPGSQPHFMTTTHALDEDQRMDVSDGELHIDLSSDPVFIEEDGRLGIPKPVVTPRPLPTLTPTPTPEPTVKPANFQVGLIPFRQIVPVNVDPRGANVYRIETQPGAIKYVAWGSDTITIPEGITLMTSVVPDDKGDFLWQPLTPGQPLPLSAFPVLLK